MQPQKSQKIDLTHEYPCPCRRRGRLTQIALTEALGCNRCQQIFVVEDGGYVLEQLSTSYPYKRAWRWTGHQWSIASTGFSESYLPVLLGVVLVMLSIGLPLALSPQNSNFLLWTIVLLLLALLSALMFLLAYRR